jgi:hypothetical protein
MDWLMTLMRVVTNSEWGSFACHNRWHLRYDLGLTSGKSKNPLRHGSLWDELLGAYYRDGGRSTVEQLRVGVIEPWLEERRAYTDTQEDGNVLADEDRESAELCRGMLAHYAKHHDSDFERWEFVAINPQMARWLDHPETGGQITDTVVIDGVSHERRWAYGGEADTLVRNKENGSWWVWENKATDATNWQKTMNDFAFQSQCRAYAWMMADPIDHPDMDVRAPIQISGTIYNVARKKIPRQPKALPTGGFSQDKSIDTTVEVYRAAVLASLNLGDDPEKHLAKYQRFLEVLATKPAFFARHEHRMTPEWIEGFGLEASNRALEIMAEEQKTEHTKQDGLCTGPMNYGCQFRSICQDMHPTAVAKFSKLGIRHTELRGVMAEPYVGKIRAVAE